MKHEATWWKRLFTVLEITFAVIGFGCWIVVRLTNPIEAPLYGILLVLVPAGLIRLLRNAVAYVVEGGYAD